MNRERRKCLTQCHTFKFKPFAFGNTALKISMLELLMEKPFCWQGRYKISLQLPQSLLSPAERKKILVRKTFWREFQVNMTVTEWHVWNEPSRTVTVFHLFPYIISENILTKCTWAAQPVEVVPTASTYYRNSKTNNCVPLCSFSCGEFSFKIYTDLALSTKWMHFACF